jgi:hypothetical protein
VQDRPTALELLAAVREFLQGEAAPALNDPRLRFRTLIAANVVAVVERELAGEADRLAEEWRRLAALDGDETAPPPVLDDLRAGIDARRRDLCRRIQAGEADAEPWRTAVWSYARWSVEEKLRVANPRYLARFAQREAGGDGASD